MATIQPEGESLRKAVQWISLKKKKQDQPKAGSSLSRQPA
jgi:hypothetical protein